MAQVALSTWQAERFNNSTKKRKPAIRTGLRP